MTKRSGTPRPKAEQPSAVTARFGPTMHNAWALGEDGVSLVRTAASPRPLRLPASPQPVEIDLAASALVIVDMQNDFCHRDGWFGQKGVDVRATRRPIPAIARLLPPWRAAGGLVVWLNWGVRADRLNLSPTIHFKGKRSADGVGYAERSPRDRGRSLVPGEWGAQVVDDLEVAPGDVTVFKHRLSGFWDNELDSVLRMHGVRTLLYAGVNTDRCVFSTLQDAGFLGYDNLLLDDACSTTSPAYVSRAIRFLVEQLHGFVARAEDLTAALACAPLVSPGSRSSASSSAPPSPPRRVARRRPDSTSRQENDR